MKITGSQTTYMTLAEAFEFLKELEDILYILEKEDKEKSLVCLTIKSIVDDKDQETSMLEIGVLTSISESKFYRGSGR